jgi:hypothetical protein
MLPFNDQKIMLNRCLREYHAVDRLIKELE